MICFLDSDDQWSRKKLERQLSSFERNKKYLISHTREIWYRRGEHLNQKKKHIPKSGDVFFQNLQLCAVGMSTVMVRRKIFDSYGLFDETMQCCEDYEFWLRIGGKEQFLLIDEQLTIKNGGRDDQVSYMNRVGMDIYRIYALEKTIERTDISCLKKRELLRECIRRCRIYASGCKKHGKIEEAVCYREKLENYKIKLKRDFYELG